ncbi:MAG: hypothetical protein ACW981_16040 [Candidatus Hodarchaeales archaeon]|jgi:hypothetical protein
MSKDNTSPTEAMFLYYGILEAYESVGLELIGNDVIEKHVIPKMSYYLKEFIPDFEIPNTKGELEEELLNFLKESKEKITRASKNQDDISFTNENVWELRAAIFGFESVFIEILGEHVIKEYVFSRIADVLSIYLPDSFSKSGTLDDKFSAYTKYISQHELVKFSNFSITDKKGTKQVKVRANKCIFAKIHDSDAYLDAKVRFCPWGMIGSAILANHEGKETTIRSCQFTTRGTISDIFIQD